MDNCGDAEFGPRQKYDHEYPDYFPQAVTNPQEAWCYPNKALEEFRRWLHEDYIGTGKFKSNVKQKVKDKQLPDTFARLAIAALGGDN